MTSRGCPGQAVSCPLRAAFTLIELLVSVAVISTLLALLVPALRGARTMGHRAACGGRLRQMATAWGVYLQDNGQRFFQEVNANHAFGGWRGRGGGARRRPLNKYLGLPMEVETLQSGKVFRCPADEGDEDYGPMAYLYYGNSFQTNLMLIGPDSLPTQKGLPEPVVRLNRRINEHLKGLKADAVCDPARLLLVGDNNWVTQWDPLIEAPGKAWHGRAGRYSLAFFDGHVAFTAIRKGVYLDPQYRVQPFRELDDLTCQVQVEIVHEP
jgi:prepilin-type N-terminal cleavage/methylation domain-containing protein